MTLGARGERAAVRHLVRNNYFIWDINVRTKFGEIDIIAAKERILVFVEVKTRGSRSSEIFSGRDAVDEDKERRIEALARRYLVDHRALVKFRKIRRCRFDVIEVTQTGGLKPLRVKQFAGAF